MYPTKRLNAAPPNAPPMPTSPATEPTAARGKMSAGTIIPRADQDCCPKNAIAKSTMAHWTGAWVTKKIHGMSAALTPSASLREKSREWPVRIRRLENQPPERLPTPEAASLRNFAATNPQTWRLRRSSSQVKEISDPSRDREGALVGDFADPSR